MTEEKKIKALDDGALDAVSGGIGRGDGSGTGNNTTQTPEVDTDDYCRVWHCYICNTTKDFMQRVWRPECCGEPMKAYKGYA